MDLVRQDDDLVLEAEFAMRVSSALVQARPAGLCGLHRIVALVSGVMRRSRSSQSISYWPLTIFIWLSLATVLVNTQIGIETDIDRRRHQHLAARRREGPQRCRDAGMDAGADAPYCRDRMTVMP